MNAAILVIIAVLAVIGFMVYRSSQNSKAAEQSRAQEARADAQRWIERLGSQVLSLAGSDTASTQALADASERFNAANGAMATASTVKDYALARESALEGLHYVNAARDIMGMPAGPALPPLEGQRAAGQVTEERTIDFEGKQITASPTATAQATHYYPGGKVAGRPVPAGWYSEPWWAGALASGMWTASSMMMFSMMFSGMAGAPSAAAFEAGYDQGLADAGDMDNAGDVADAGDMGDGGDMGGDDGGLFDGLFDGGGFDFFD